MTTTAGNTAGALDEDGIGSRPASPTLVQADDLEHIAGRSEGCRQ